MQRWRERTIILAAAASDIGLFGSVLYFIVLTKLADQIQVDFVGWFLGLGLICLWNEWMLRRGVSLRAYTWWNILWGSVLCIFAMLRYETDPFSWWSQVWFFGMLAASIVHSAYLSFHKPPQSTGLLYLDGTIAALVLVQIWEYLSGGGKSSSLGMFLVFCIGMNFLALLLRTLSAQKEEAAAGEGTDTDENGRFPVFVPVMFLVVLMAGMFLSLLFGKGLSEGLIGAVLGVFAVIWKWIRLAGELFYRAMLWLAYRMAKEDTGSLSAIPMQEVSSQAAEMESLIMPGWVMPVLAAVGALVLIAVVLIIGKIRLKKSAVQKAVYEKEPVIRRRSESLFSVIWKCLKEQILYVYRYIFHPEDISMLVKCAQNYGRRKQTPRKAQETLVTYFTRLGQLPEVAAAAVRLQELSERYYYAKERPVITRAEGKEIQKKFRGR